jgi:zinc protease
VLVIAGDVRPADVKPKVERHFGRLAGTPVARPDYYDLEPKQIGERRLTMRRNVKVPQMLVAWHTPGIRDSDYVAGSVLAGVLAQGRNSRLYRTLVTDSGLAVSVGGYNWVQRDPDMLRLYITPRSEDVIPRIERLVELEVARLRTELATEREIEKVKNGVLAENVFDRDDVSGMAYLLAANQILEGSWRAYRTFPEQVARVTREQVRDFCRDYLTRDNQTTGVLLPQKEGQ